jgi:hypothetical protein
LLSGRLDVRTRRLHTSDPVAVIRVVLERDAGEERRKFWNDRLMYLEYDWMQLVRVWDAEHRWLYPNLPYLFRLHGEDRIERYGGWDPVKQVDNDFGAVLIRKYRLPTAVEARETASQPLVSAAWYPAGGVSADRFAVVHVAQSDEFTIHLADGGVPARGRIKVWFVYGDFLGHAAPRSWPEQPEHAGGTLAFFQVDWHLQAGQPLEVELQQLVPEHTGFDWRAWIGRQFESDPPIGIAKLTDR